MKYFRHRRFDELCSENNEVPALISDCWEKAAWSYEPYPEDWVKSSQISQTDTKTKRLLELLVGAKKHILKNIAMVLIS